MEQFGQGRPTQQRYEGLLSHYMDTFGRQCLNESYRLGNVGVTLMSADQSCGDWSDPPIPELVLTQLKSEALDMTCDFGGGRGRRRMLAGSLVVVPPDFATTFLMDQAHRAEFIALPYHALLTRLDWAGDFGLPTDGNFGWLHTQIAIDPMVSRCMDQLLHEARLGNPHGALGADGMILQLLGALVALRDRGSSSPGRSGLAPWQVKRVTQRIEDNLADDVSLSELAKLVGLSPSYFCRAFARSTGLPPHRWRLKRRIDRACELLAGTNLTVTAIATSLGFATPQHFSALFRDRIGMTPSAYRNERWN